MKLKSKDLFYKSPSVGMMVTAKVFYTHREGPEMMRLVNTLTRSDTVDTIHGSFSNDNGRTWTDPAHNAFITQTTQGIHRQYIQPGFVDIDTDRLLLMVFEGTLPGDDPLQGMKQWYLSYRVSTDGGRTTEVNEQVVQQGSYTTDHPFEGVWVGKNGIMIGDTTCRPIKTGQGKLLVPVQVSPIGPDGEYYNPGDGYTYHMSAVLIGTWQKDGRIEWELSEYVENEPSASTRGAVEPTISEMPDGRILMVMRGSNDANHELPGYKWYSVSPDGGYTWAGIRPWPYTDGTPFFSPSSCSQLMSHSNGCTYWLGNLTHENPRGNHPRYPLVIGKVDSNNLLLIKKSVMKVDDCQPGEHKKMCLSNFIAYEDRESRYIVLYMSRMFTRGLEDWSADAYVYRIVP